MRFVLLPTAYGFAAGHCVRVAIAGADSKHLTVDHQGDRTIWVHTGGIRAEHAACAGFASTVLSSGLHQT